jgi:hypothetical protein
MYTLLQACLLGDLITSLLPPHKATTNATSVPHLGGKDLTFGISTWSFPIEASVDKKERQPIQILKEK